jgi:hypothetical protein
LHAFSDFATRSDKCYYIFKVLNKFHIGWSSSFTMKSTAAGNIEDMVIPLTSHLFFALTIYRRCLLCHAVQSDINMTMLYYLSSAVCGIWLSIYNNEKVICGHLCKKTLTREDGSEVRVIGILVLLLLCLTSTSTTNTAFELPFVIDEAKAIMHKTSPTPSLPPLNSIFICSNTRLTHLLYYLYICLYFHNRGF